MRIPVAPFPLLLRQMEQLHRPRQGGHIHRCQGRALYTFPPLRSATFLRAAGVMSSGITIFTFGSKLRFPFRRPPLPAPSLLRLLCCLTPQLYSESYWSAGLILVTSISCPVNMTVAPNTTKETLYILCLRANYAANHSSSSGHWAAILLHKSMKVMHSNDETDKITSCCKKDKPPQNTLSHPLILPPLCLSRRLKSVGTE
ncbi:hypothetical protein E2C01_016750 [Portunus trituberculatus]|uniref:Uncharacterized protein n=1 Tax=Portunus trituberculatus TaxID=210409 RepID=A0A5B7DQ95_PORTR|nr:hypothetical protein [Portunus trituberculatus]